MDLQQKVEMWRIDRLRAHPAQRELFGEPPEHEIHELMASIGTNGLKHGIEILPDGTILAGHRRLRALQLLGRTEVDVVVRHYLADDPQAAERELIQDNLIRRQLGPLEIAGSYQRLIELEKGRPRDLLSKVPRVNYVEQLASRLRTSRRNLDRYLAVLRAPREVQEAFDAGQLSLVLAARVPTLAAQKRDRIAAAIRAGTTPSIAIRTELPTQRNKPEMVQSDYGSFLRLIPILAGNVDQVIRSPEGDVETLHRGTRLIEELLQAPTRGRKCSKRPARTTSPSGY